MLNIEWALVLNRVFLFPMLYPKMFLRIICTYSMYVACIKDMNGDDDDDDVDSGADY